MKISKRLAWISAVLIIALGFRFWQNQQDWQKQSDVFPSPTEGIFKVWVAEEPEVFFEHEPLSHDTGRGPDNYLATVKEVRTVCEMMAFNGISVSPLRVRCVFKLSPAYPQSLFSYGATLELDGKIQRPSGAMNPGQFDYAQYLKTKGVAYVTYLSPGHWRATGEGGGARITPLAMGLPS